MLGGQGAGRCFGALLGAWGYTATTTGHVEALGGRAQSRERGLRKSGSSEARGLSRLRAYRAVCVCRENVTALCVLLFCNLALAPGPQAGTYGAVPASLSCLVKVISQSV